MSSTREELAFQHAKDLTICAIENNFLSLDQDSNKNANTISDFYLSLVNSFLSFND